VSRQNLERGFQRITEAGKLSFVVTSLSWG
jgi:hypothetical protein